MDRIGMDISVETEIPPIQMDMYRYYDQSVQQHISQQIPGVIDEFTREQLEQHTFSYLPSDSNADILNLSSDVPLPMQPLRQVSLTTGLPPFESYGFDSVLSPSANMRGVSEAFTFNEYEGYSQSQAAPPGQFEVNFKASLPVDDAQSRKRIRGFAGEEIPASTVYIPQTIESVPLSVAIPMDSPAPLPARSVSASKPKLTKSNSASKSSTSISSLPTSIRSKQTSEGSLSPSSPNPISPSQFNMLDKDEQKKVKHQLTDRHRRAKIKESMDQLKALVPLDKDQKADQATVVQQSVEFVRGLKNEVSDLRKRIAELELNARDSKPSNDRDSALKNYLVQQSYLSTSPFSAMMASLNGAGVCMWRVGLDGRILDVNLTFEMVTGFPSSDIINKSPCGAPLYGSLSVMPKSFLRFFSQVSTIISPVHSGFPPPGFPQSPYSTSSPYSSSPTQSPISTSSMDSQNSPHTPNSPPYQTNSSLPTPASASSHLFSSITISALPIVPQNELQSFFPFKCRTLGAEATNGGPQPHGQYLINHLSNLPAHHVLKLLSRVSTSFGDTLESIQTMCLVRNEKGLPDYILCLTTPDGRRLVKPTKFLSPMSPLNPQQQSAVA